MLEDKIAERIFIRYQILKFQFRIDLESEIYKNSIIYSTIKTIHKYTGTKNTDFQKHLFM